MSVGGNMGVGENVSVGGCWEWEGVGATVKV